MSYIDGPDYSDAGIGIDTIPGVDGPVYWVFRDGLAVEPFRTHREAHEHAQELYLDLVADGMVGRLEPDEDLVPAGYEW